MDQAFYAGHCAAGQREVMQVGWLYDRPVNLDKLRQFNSDIGHTMLGRRIERSPLPFGRYRWVAAPDPIDLDIAPTPRPREEFADWLDECAQKPLDTEAGPGWRVSAVELSDGYSGATIVMSHYIADGIGLVIGASQAIMGDKSGCGYPPPHSLSRTRAALRDARETLAATPALARAVAAAAREARARRGDTRAQPSRAVAVPESATAPAHLDDDLDAPVIIPNLWVELDMDAFNARAEELDGRSNTLVVAVTAKIDERMGRPHGDTDDVKLMLLVNNRTPGDVRALAVSFARLSIDPSGLTTDLSDARTAVRLGLQAQREEQDTSPELVALTPFTPKKAWKQLVEYALKDPESPAVCSNLGDTGPAIHFPDGGPCVLGVGRGTSAHITRRWLARMGGQLNVYFGISPAINQVWFQVRGYQEGTVTTKEQLREVVQGVLDEFKLSGRIH